MVRVAVLGAGVNGVGCAIRIKEKWTNMEVVLISEEFSPNTTGDGSAGFWYPYLCGNTPEDKLLEWGKVTYHFMHKLWLEGVKGISLMPAYLLDQTIEEHPSWKDIVFGFHVMDQRHLQYMSDMHSTCYKHGFSFITFTTEPTSLLPHLTARFTNAGGSVVRAAVTSLHGAILKDFDVVVNCVGLGARALVPDTKVFPIRGQVARVKAPWVYQVLLDHSGGNYIIPNVERCVLGGTHQEDDYNTSVDPLDSKLILQGCRKMMPSLENAEVVGEWAGLRPARDTVRLEAETIDNKLVIHNYGHGGSGVTLFWGCAGNVLEILESALNKQPSEKLSSKL